MHNYHIESWQTDSIKIMVIQMYYGNFIGVCPIKEIRAVLSQLIILRRVQEGEGGCVVDIMLY